MTEGKPFRPLLAATLEEADIDNIEYPKLGSYKIDGIRVICHPKLGPITRAAKPVPNDYIREYLSHPRFKLLDGEIVVGNPNHPDSFNATQSAVMTKGGQPDFTYLVFDSLPFGNLPCPFHTRLNDAEQIIKDALHGEGDEPYPRVMPWRHEVMTTPDEVRWFEEDAVTAGWEGVMLRDPNGPYKNGRSTLKQGTLLKLKRFVDAEAIVEDWVPYRQNQNEPKQNELGYQTRSSHKAGKVEISSMIGTLIVRGVGGRWDGVQFEVGSGFSHDQREIFARYFDTFKGKTIVYKYQAHGGKERPRAPIFKGFRHPSDILLDTESSNGK